MIISYSNLKNYILQNSTFANENTIDIVVSNLLMELEKYGFDLNNLYVRSGETSINFIKDNIVIRLTYIRYNDYDTLSDYVSHSNSILQPKFERKINTGEINYPTILGLKRLQIGTVTEEERDSIYIKLREDGYLFNDAAKLENFGKDENGNIYLIDYGELIYINDYKKLNDSNLHKRKEYEKYIDRELKYHINACKKLHRKYIMSLKKKKIWLAKLKVRILKTRDNSDEQKSNDKIY